MVIKKLNADMFDKIATKAKKPCVSEPVTISEDYEEGSLSEKDAEFLYQEGLTELAEIAQIIDFATHTISLSSFGEELIDTDEFISFRDSMDYFLSFVIPKLLEGKIDDIVSNNEALEDDEEYREQLNALRVRFFNNLSKNHLNK